MSNSVKVTLYVALAILASVSGYFAMTNFSRMMARAGDRTSALEQIEPERKPAEPSDTPVPTNTTNESSTTNEVAGGTNAVTVTNVTAEATNAAVQTQNSAEVSTNQAAGKATVEEEQNPRTAVPTALSGGSSSRGSQKGGGRIGVWTGVFVLSLIALGLLIASDVSHFFGNRALRVLYNDEGEGLKNPDYEKAEEVWANGEHLEAIRLMREYLGRNPREQHVAIRIAEIYEKDLKNNLAAALEYEEVLKHKLPPDRWAWAAVHLCNLYFRINQEQKAFDLLRRIVKEYPNTPAAEKARKRLEQVDGAAFSDQQSLTEVQVRDPSEHKQSSGAPEKPSNLPPGFRPKK